MFGWGIFQALFIRDMAGSSSVKSLRVTFIPELLSMNCLMAGMIPVAMIGKTHYVAATRPVSPVFWFFMSIALTIGAFIAYPMNWWLVKHGLKHGMLTVRPAASEPPASSMAHEMPAHEMPKMGAREMPMQHSAGHARHRGAGSGAAAAVGLMMLVSFGALGAGIVIAAVFSNF